MNVDEAKNANDPPGGNRGYGGSGNPSAPYARGCGLCKHIPADEHGAQTSRLRQAQYLVPHRVLAMNSTLQTVALLRAPSTLPERRRSESTRMCRSNRIEILFSVRRDQRSHVPSRARLSAEVLAPRRPVQHARSCQQIKSPRCNALKQASDANQCFAMKAPKGLDNLGVVGLYASNYLVRSNKYCTDGN